MHSVAPESYSLNNDDDLLLLKRQVDSLDNKNKEYKEYIKNRELNKKLEDMSYDINFLKKEIIKMHQLLQQFTGK